MSIEREIYMDSFTDLLKTKDLKMATTLQKEWTNNLKGKNMAAAACFYLNNFVIPTLVNNQRTPGGIPKWVDELLFHPLEEPVDITSFLALYGSEYVDALDERYKGVTSRTAQFWGAGELLASALTPEKLLEAKELNLGIYFTPNPITGNKLSEKGSRRLDENVTKFSSCFADFDGGDKMNQMLRIELFCPEPSLIVESKNGYWPYWLLADDVTEREWRLIMNGIIKTCDSDKSVKNPSRLARLPFTWHCKTDDKFLCRIAKFSGKRYTKDELAKAFNVDFMPPKVYSPSTEMPRNRDLRTPAPAFLSAGNRHPTLQAEAGRIYAGISQDKAQDARDMIHFWYERSCSPLKPNWRKEVDDACDWVERREFSTVTSNRHG